MKKGCLSSFSLKLIAIVTMTIDHVGYVLLPRYFFLRGIGRLAFPIFCFLLSEGLSYTKSRSKYLLRLSVFAILAEVPFDLAFNRAWFDVSDQNVFFTLALSFGAIWCYDTLRRLPDGNFWIAFLSIFPFCAAAELLRTDYGMWGVLFVAAFWVLREKPVFAMLAFAAVNIVLSLFDSHIVQMYALCAIPLLLLYNGKKGFVSNKYVFYAYYPFHLLVIHLIECWKYGLL